MIKIVRTKIIKIIKTINVNDNKYIIIISIMIKWA